MIICGCCSAQVLTWGSQLGSCCGAGILVTTVLSKVWMMLIVPPASLAVNTLVDEGSVAMKTGLWPTCTVATTPKLLELTTLTVASVGIGGLTPKATFDASKTVTELPPVLATYNRFRNGSR